VHTKGSKNQAAHSKDHPCPHHNQGYFSPTFGLSFLAICLYINITFTDISKLVSSPPLRRECATVRAELLDVAGAIERDAQHPMPLPLLHDEA
jgi:hypothetical protein